MHAVKRKLYIPYRQDDIKAQSENRTNIYEERTEIPLKMLIKLEKTEVAITN